MKRVKTNSEKTLRRGASATLFLTAVMGIGLMGCEQREDVLDIETPGADIDVDETAAPDGSRGIDIDVNAD